MNTNFICLYHDDKPADDLFATLETTEWMQNCNDYKTTLINYHEVAQEVEYVIRQLAEKVTAYWRMNFKLMDFPNMLGARVSLPPGSDKPSVKFLRYVWDACVISIATDKLRTHFEQPSPNDIVLWFSNVESANWMIDFAQHNDNFKLAWDSLINDCNVAPATVINPTGNPVNGPPWVFHNAGPNSIAHFGMACHHFWQTTFMPTKLMEALTVDKANYIQDKLENNIIGDLVKKTSAWDYNINDHDLEKQIMINRSMILQVSNRLRQN